MVYCTRCYLLLDGPPRSRWAVLQRCHCYYFCHKFSGRNNAAVVLLLECAFFLAAFTGLSHSAFAVLPEGRRRCGGSEGEGARCCPWLSWCAQCREKGLFKHDARCTKHKAVHCTLHLAPC